MRKLLARIGLDRPELRAWAMYDWANSAFQSTVITAVFPPFFARYAASGLAPAEATARFSLATTLAMTITAFLGPVLGAVADLRAMKKRLLAVSMGVGVIATLLMATIGRGHWQYAAVLFVIGNIGIAASLVFYDSLLPHIAAPAEIDRVSTAGYAVGYLGGGLLLVINLLWILTPHAFGLPDQTAGTKLSLASVGVWCLLFSLPLFFGVREPAGLSPAPRFSVSQPFRQAVATLLELWTYRQAFLMLVAFLLYNDGIQTMIRMAAIYATEIGIDLNAQIAAFVMVQFVGVPCSFLFGALADRIGAKRAVLASIVVYVGISVWGYVLHTAWQFFVLAFLVATVQGGSQALSRSLFARMIPKAKSSEYFGFFSVFDKFAGIFGPALYFASVVMFGSSRSAVLSVMLLFIAGGVVLSFVDVAAGEAAAAAAETGAP